MNGWVIYPTGGEWGLIHTSGFMVAGFGDRAEAAFWLQDFLLRRTAQEQQHERARERILARMRPMGRVS